MVRHVGGWVLALCVLLPVAAGAADVGRLFSTPAERAALDAQRQQGPRNAGTHTPVVAGDKITLDGVIVRKGARGMVWLNGGTAPLRDALPAGVRGPGSSGRVNIDLPQNGRTVQLKPGQRWDATSGRIEEAYERAGGPAAAAVADTRAE